MALNDPQIWTLIGVFAAAMLGGFSLVTTRLGRVIRAEVDRLDGKLTGQIESLEGRLSGQINALDAKLSGRIDTLDKEVASLAERFWRSP